jgi:GntR family transcriptional regulator/MocR family aminotransferase
VVVLSGTEQMLQFIVSELTAPGSLVWTEDPGATYLRRTLVDAGFALCAIPVDERGISVAEGMRIAPAARVAVVAPSHQYPTGISMGLERRRELVAWAESTSGWIVENEIDGDYRYAPRPLPSLYGLSAAHRVVYCGSLSKALAPGLRINYLVLPATLAGTLRWRATLAPMLTQHVLARFSTAGHMTAHMNRMRNLYARRRAALLQALREQAADLLDVPALPETGLRIRATLLCAADDRRVAQRCLQQGIKVDALSVCYVNRPPIRGLIIGFASTPEEHMGDAVAKLVRVIREEAGQ